MKPSEPNGTRRHVKYAIIVFVVLFAILGFFLVGEYRALRRARIVNLHELHLSALFRHHGSLTANDVNVIRPWMTFDYVNKLFNIPADHLKTQLGITDTRYPQLSLAGYARSAHFDVATFTDNVMGVVRDYLTANAK